MVDIRYTRAACRLYRANRPPHTPRHPGATGSLSAEAEPPAPSPLRLTMRLHRGNAPLICTEPVPTDFLPAIAANLLSPAVLFFALGLAAALLRSDLKFPEALYVTLTIYLLSALGFKGGAAIHEAGASVVLVPALAAIVLGALIPAWTYPLLRFAGKMRPVDAAAVAAHYGSVSAVTFITATNYLKNIDVPYESYAPAFLAVMESPGIIVGVLLGKLSLDRRQFILKTSLIPVLREAIFGRSVLLLVGSLLIGAACGNAGMETMEGFFATPFQGVLALFLLEMGLVAGQRIEDLKKVGLFLVAFGILLPLVHGAIGVLLGKYIGLSLGGMTLMGALAASASYIAAPAAMRLSLPEANPSLYLTSALAITFPFNIAIGIPVYYRFAGFVLG